MKKSIYIIFVVVLLYLLPLEVYAEKFNPKDTDISIEFDTNEWYVFTRDNIHNNTEFPEIGITYDYLNNFMNNNYVYLDAVLLYENNNSILEFIIRKTKADSIINFSNYTDEDILDIAKGLADKQNASRYDIYINNYKYAYLDYTDKGYYLVEYYTVVNGDSYTITVQKTSPIDLAEKEKIRNIVDTIVLEIDDSLKEISLKKTKSSSILGKTINGAICGAIIGIIIYIISLFVNKRKIN